jgi:hypothetical protein
MMVKAKLSGRQRGDAEVQVHVPPREGELLHAADVAAHP